jgi:predicted transcriptional regulator
VVTDGGAEVAVIVDAPTFRALQAAEFGRQLLDDLQQAIAEADAGDLVDHEEVMAELRGYFRGRVSPEIMRQLGEE